MWLLPPNESSSAVIFPVSFLQFFQISGKLSHVFHNGAYHRAALKIGLLQQPGTLTVVSLFGLLNIDFML